MPEQPTSDRKIRLALIFGGQSAEHEVSLASARSVLRAVDPTRYEVLPIAISPRGDWMIGEPAIALLGPPAPAEGTATSQDVVARADLGTAARVAHALSPAGPRAERGAIDVVFPVLHGPHGEDGTVQGLLELAGVPYVGAGVAASAVGMDKILMKRLFLQAGLPVVPFIAVTRAEWHDAPDAVARRVAEVVGFPCFAKPANMGSSLGISRVEGPHALAAALDGAAHYDRRLLVERAAPAAREIECGVLGNEKPAVSAVGEIRVHDAPFYTFEAKYEDGASDLIVPADLPTEVSERARDLARRAYLAVDGAGMARVDFLLCGDGELYVSEINTIPGFTPTSMFPLLWAASGLPYAALIDRLVELAIERHGG
ncbi:MAG TPA: D-alanine--D-alanine ligase family protein [Chloroflexota bacterium]|nr:D-alanine--D-alanine ligase family protein [Chloroflexota bacterium]